MIEKNNYVLALCKIHEYCLKIEKICERYDYVFNKIVGDDLPYNACLMLVFQIGEELVNLKKSDNKYLALFTHNATSFISMRKKIIYCYSDIDRMILKKLISDLVPELKKYIEVTIDKKIIVDPYSLYEFDYDDLVSQSDILVIDDEILNSNNMSYLKAEKSEDKEM